jgi:hypothetical protein
MNDILVKKTKSTEYGFLIPKYDEESAILEVTAKKSKDWVYGIDIDGSLIFDIDKDLLIENFDVCINKKYWKKIDKFPNYELVDDTSHNIVIDKKCVKTKSFNYKDLIFLTDKKHENLMITFNLSNHDRILRMHKISSKCFCFINDDVLKGFLIDLRKG